MEEIFTYIYENCIWGDNGIEGYKGSSGWGSDLTFNELTFIPFLKGLIKSKNITTITDLGCGDFKCGLSIYDDLDVYYTGYDVYKKIVEHNKKIHPSEKYNFIHLDFCNNPVTIKSSDLCILKDVLQHWKTEDIYQFLDYITSSKKFKYILIVNCCDQREDNEDITTGNWRQLSCHYLPLKKYSPKLLFKYATKEVSLIEL